MSIINVGGFGNTGSSAVIDLLLDYDDIWMFTNGGYTYEHIIMWHPRGIIETYLKLKHVYFGLQSDAIIRDFLKFIKFVKTQYGGSQIFGANDDLLGKELDKIVEEFVRGISSKEGCYMSVNYIENRIVKKLFNNRYAKRLKLNKIYNRLLGNKQGWYTISVDDNQLREYTKNFIYKYLVLFNSDAKNIIYDALWPIEYFNLIPELCPKDWKNIIVHRDPRDRYLDELEFCYPPIVPKDPHVYCNNYKRAMNLYKNINMQNMLIIVFEELIINYDKIVPLIERFVGCENKNYAVKKHFDPGVSINNIEIHRRNEVREKYRKELDIIEIELNEYLIDVDKANKKVSYDSVIYGI